MTASQLADRMIANGYDVRIDGDGYRACCPAHGGTDRNMTIRTHSEGGAICTCMSHHCSRSDIAKAMGLTMAEIVGGDTRGNGHRSDRGDQGNRVFPYRDEKGTLLFEVVRSADKRFWQRLPGAKAGGIGDVRRVLFGLPELLATNPGEVVGIAEGEQCAIAVASVGIACTTNPHGAGKWRPDYTAWLKENLPDRKFLLLPDNDTEGKKHVVAVGDSLQAAGLEHYLADLGVLPAKGDVADWLAAGGTKEALLAMAVPTPPEERFRSAGIFIIRDDELAIAILPEPIFVIDGILPVGYTLLASKPKIGKTRGITGLAEAVASGGKAMGNIDVSQGEVLFLAMESDLQDVQSRLLDIRGNSPPTGMLYVSTQWPNASEGGLTLLEEWLVQHPRALLVIIDTIAKLKPSVPRNADIYAEDYKFGASLKRIADEHQIALMGLHHQRKAASEDTFDTMSGTLGTTAACDALWVLQRTRGQADAMISMTGRKIREQEIAIRQDEHIGTWLYLGDADEFRKSRERAEVLRVLKSAGGPLMPSEIADELGKRADAIRQLLRRMVQSKEIIRSEKGGYSRLDLFG